MQKNQRRFFSNYSKKIAKEKMLPNPFHKVSVTLIPKSDKDITKKKANYRTISLINLGAQIINKVISKLISTIH